jgi:hypothetical protein
MRLAALGQRHLDRVEVAREDGGRLMVGTFSPEHFREFFLNPYFPSIPAIDLARFPDPDGLCAALASAGFAGAAVERFDQNVTAAAADVLERVRGRYISTLRLLDADEYEAGLARLEADVAAGVDSVSYMLRWALVTARRG